MVNLKMIVKILIIGGLMSEVCDRCGSVGVDRRTLSMDCFYHMEELGIPFKRETVLIPEEDANLTIAQEPTIIEIEGMSIAIGSGTVTCDGELSPKQEYTLRVCKRCRSEWMQAIKHWFEDIPQGEDYDADEPVPNENPTGIFIRENGNLKQITEEEWNRRMQERENQEEEPEF